jgi:hypothetical protein
VASLFVDSVTCALNWSHTNKDGFLSKFHYLTIKMLYNRCTGIYKFGNNTYPRCIRRRLNLGHIFREKSASYEPGNRYIHWWTGASNVFSYRSNVPWISVWPSHSWWYKMSNLLLYLIMQLTSPAEAKVFKRHMSQRQHIPFGLLSVLVCVTVANTHWG